MFPPWGGSAGAGRLTQRKDRIVSRIYKPMWKTFSADEEKGIICLDFFTLTLSAATKNIGSNDLFLLFWFMPIAQLLTLFFGILYFAVQIHANMRLSSSTEINAVID